MIKSWLDKLDKRENMISDSIRWAFNITGGIATIMTISGTSLSYFSPCMRFIIILIVFLLLCLVCCYSIGKNDSISLKIRQTSVTITHGDIFSVDGWKVIGCDTHFDTRVDDVVISKKSLHGRLVLDHGDAEKIKEVVEEEAKRQKLAPNKDGLYTFPLGTIIRYQSSKDNQTYLMLALSALNKNHEAHTDMATFVQMLIEMWKNLNSVYASNVIVLPLLGTGILRLDDRPRDNGDMLRCMLYTLSMSGVSFNSEVKIVIYGDNKDLQLYEYKNLLS